jgi:prepilin-type N-terminal cleavage/methylation domain-containing protein
MVRRKGFSILELVVVMAVLLILGALVVPTLFGSRRDTHVKAGSDIVHTYIAKARAKAIEDGKPYRLALYADGKKVQIQPDLDDGGATDDDDPSASGPLICEENFPEGVMAVIVIGGDDYAPQDQSGWQRVATFLPDGTCREENVEIRVSEKGAASITLTIRGVTGNCVTSKGGSSP